MYLNHFSLSERPFSISPDPRFLFMSNRYREALAHLTYGVADGGGFVLLTGEVGTGKTTVCRCLLQQLPKKTRLAFVLNPKLNSLELLATICDELNIEYPENCTSLKILTDKLSQYLLDCYEQGLSVVVMIDEAQNIATDVLEQIRLLTNLETNQKKLLQIILVGQPELQEKLAQRDLRQLAQRITARYHLRPLNLKETMAYVLHRVKIAGGSKNLFSRKSIELLHQKTAGIPRLINTICDRALMAATSRNKSQVDHRIIQDAIQDVMGSPLSPSQPVNHFNEQSIKWAIISVLMLCILGGTFWIGKNSNTINLDKLSVQQIDEQTPLTRASEVQNIRKTESSRKTQSIESNIIDHFNASNFENVSNNSINNAAETSRPSLLERMIGEQRWDNNGNWSMQKLLSLWQVEYSPISDGVGCDFAASYGLICRTMQGNWQQLRMHNRPVILKFSAGIQGEFWGTLKSITGLQAALIFGEREVEIKIDELSSIWTGEYQLIWQAPEGYAGDIRMGDQGRVVMWLSEKMKLLVDNQLKLTEVFNNELSQTLKEYQSRRNINADGIAGMQTILMINGETLSGIPVLQEGKF